MEIYNQKENLWFMAWAKWDPVKRYTEEYQIRAATTNYYDPAVTNLRKKWVYSNCDINQSFDYGCGMRPFHYNFDTGESECKGLWDKYTPPFTEFDRKSYMESSTMLLFDVIEHIYDPHTFLLTLHQKRLLLTVPTFPAEKLNALEQVRDWKHYREGEHFLYTTEEGFIDICEESNWKIEDKGYWECPPRSNILSLVLVRDQLCY